MAQEDAEQQTFPGRKRDRLALPTAAGQSLGLRIEQPIAEPVALARRLARGRRQRCRPPQHGLDTGQQFARVERFGDVIVGAHFQADDAVGLLGHGGQKDDRQTRRRP